MKVTFLGSGTSQGVPVIGCTCEVCSSLDYRDKRLRSSIHIAIEGNSFVIDTGPDFRQQMLREKINKLDAVIFTHAHRDHTAGLDDVRAYNFLQQADMPIYGTKDVIAQLQKEYSYAFVKDSYPGLPRLNVFEITDTPFEINNITVTPLPVRHLHLPVFGYRIGNFSYITDANYISDETLERLKGTDVLILNALQKQPHISHFNLEQAIEQIEKIKPVKTYFTHISHKLGTYSDILKELPAHIHLGYDGLKIEC